MSSLQKALRSNLALAAALGIGLVSAPQANAAPSGFSVDASQPIQVFGTGCPGTTARAVQNGDSVSVIFSGFSAQAYPGTSDTKSCNIRMVLNVPSGFTVQPVNVSYVGSVALNPGGSAMVTTYARFSGASVMIDQFKFPNSQYASNYTGGWDRSVDTELPAFNACSAPRASVFGLNTSLTANARHSPTIRIGVDTADMTIGQPIFEIKFQFNPC